MNIGKTNFFFVVNWGYVPMISGKEEAVNFGTYDGFPQFFVYQLHCL